MLEIFLMEFCRAFIIGGLICVFGQLMFDIAKLTPAHTMSVLVCLGSLLGIFGLYSKLADYAGFGATLPISSFGNTLVQGAVKLAQKDGFWGLFSGILQNVSAGITAAVVFGFVVAVCFKPRL